MFSNTLDSVHESSSGRRFPPPRNKVHPCMCGHAPTDKKNCYFQMRRTLGASHDCGNVLRSGEHPALVWNASSTHTLAVSHPIMPPKFLTLVYVAALLISPFCVRAQTTGTTSVTTPAGLPNAKCSWVFSMVVRFSNLCVANPEGSNGNIQRHFDSVSID